MTPEHLHLALNHLPFVGAACAALPIAAGLIWNKKSVLVVGLVLATVTGWITPLVMETGEQAYERYKDGPIRTFLDPAAETFLEIHEHRAEDWAFVLYISAASATIALAATVWNYRVGRWISVFSLTACLAAVTAGVWIAESGGKIRRPDFRITPQAAPADAKKETREYDSD